MLAAKALRGQMGLGTRPILIGVCQCISPYRSARRSVSKLTEGLVEEEVGYKGKAPAQVLKPPIGVANRPSSLGIDGSVRKRKSWQEKKKELLDPYEYAAKRREMYKEMKGSVFQEAYDFRENRGKDWIAPESLIRADKSLYMPNLRGRTLASRQTQDTTPVLAGKYSILRFVPTVTSVSQVESYFPQGWEKDLSSDYQVVDVDIIETWLKKLIATINIRAIKKTAKNPERYSKYFMTLLNDIPPIVRNDIKHYNKFAGYIYLIDPKCRIRWAACGEALPQERESLWRCLDMLRKRKGE